MRIRLNNKKEDNFLGNNFLRFNKNMFKNIKKGMEKKKREKRIRKFLKSIVDTDYSFSTVMTLIVCSFLIGVVICFTVFMFIFKGTNYFVLSRDLNKLVEVYDTIISNYYNDIDKDKLIDDAIDSMVSSVGDVYTNYADSDAAASFDELVSGKYEGIGCTIQKSSLGVVVASVFENSPSFKAGLLEGDIIITVDGKDVKEMTVDELSTYIKTKSNGKIDMVVLREGEEKTINLVRDIVETPVVESFIYEKNGKKIGYLDISIFSSVADEQFKQKLSELEKDDISGLVIDVRSNNGGYLTTVTEIASELLSKGNVIYQVERDNKKEIVKDKTLNSKDYPIAVLVNGASASASEILAASTLFLSISPFKIPIISL